MNYDKSKYELYQLDFKLENALMVILATCKYANDERSMLYISIFLKKSQNFSIRMESGWNNVAGDVTNRFR